MPMEIKISMRQVMKFTLDEIWNLRTRDMAFSQDVTYPQDVTLYLHA